MKTFYFALLSVGICFTSKAQELSTTMLVSAGATVYVSSGEVLYASEITLKSTSDRFSTFFLDGALGVSTVVNYDRYVNVIGNSGVPGGNDLISLPVKTASPVTFGDFLNYSQDNTKNSDILPNSPYIASVYAFGPYDNIEGSYINYDATADANMILSRGKGYRAATKNNGHTLRFTGTVSTVSETIEISTNSIAKNRWNLVGNPYPTYIDSQKFLIENLEQLDSHAAAIYGYNSTNSPSSGTIGNFTIINLNTNKDVNIAPGQGFFLANNPNASTHQLTFTQAMRTSNGTDDFILGRDSNQNQKLRLRASHDSADFVTEIYFNANSTFGLDPGYDAAVYSGTNNDFMLYSHLVENNTGRNMAIQSLNSNDLNDLIIPLGLKTSQGKQITFSIEEFTLPEGSRVYLEDRKTNMFTLLNTANYTFTSGTALSGVGRFFLRIENRVLTTPDKETKGLEIFASKQTLHINGQIIRDTTVSIYDIQGRLIMTSFLPEGSAINKIDVTRLSYGIYVVKLSNEQHSQTKKVIIK